ncbi:alanine racemase [Mesorhizobium abyssinicae]|uniref:alanine racemase n=1 Tax=Mesorhizobium abyssinicae TaxID=1209958 RepID=UPI003398CDB1
MTVSPDAHPPQAWIETSIGAFENNLRNVMNRLSDGTELCAVVKADAYGAGAAAMMPSILRANVPCVGVADNQEAQVVRSAGFRGRLMRLRTATAAEIVGAMGYDLEEMVGNIETARLINAISISCASEIPVHLNLNSAGMSREGMEISTDCGRRAVLDMVAHPHLRIVGIMSHFADVERQHILHSLEIFRRDTDWIFQNTTIRREAVLLHIANSLATLRVPTCHFDMVRTGAALYGCVGARPPFRHVLAFKSRISSVGEYPAGGTIGYGRTASLARWSRLATIPVGYANGYRQSFGNNAAVLVQGQRAPVIGRVSMNSIVADVTDIVDARSGDEVVLFGRQGDAEIGQAEVEALAGVVLSDLFSGWGKSNARVTAP